MERYSQPIHLHIYGILQPQEYIVSACVNEQSSAGILGCRIASNYVVINVHAKPDVNAGSDRVMFNGESVTLEGKVTGEDPVFYWGHLII
jgi:hypothetical protein